MVLFLPAFLIVLFMAHLIHRAAIGRRALRYLSQRPSLLVGLAAALTLGPIVGSYAAGGTIINIDEYKTGALEGGSLPVILVNFAVSQVGGSGPLLPLLVIPGLVHVSRRIEQFPVFLTFAFPVAIFPLVGIKIYTRPIFPLLLSLLFAGGYLASLASCANRRALSGRMCGGISSCRHRSEPSSRGCVGLGPETRQGPGPPGPCSRRK